MSKHIFGSRKATVKLSGEVVETPPPTDAEVPPDVPAEPADPVATEGEPSPPPPEEPEEPHPQSGWPVSNPSQAPPQPAGAPDWIAGLTPSDQHRVERFEQLGAEAIKMDLMGGGRRLIGGTLQVQQLARTWLSHQHL